MENLQEQIDNASRSIFTDSYSMSIGELMSMYKDKEIDVHPEFQRAFRWEIDQKSALVESILLGIPMPPIFVYHRNDGIWDVIDGQQRLSTIFQFAGIYRNENDEGGCGRFPGPFTQIQDYVYTPADSFRPERV